MNVLHVFFIPTGYPADGHTHWAYVSNARHKQRGLLCTGQTPHLYKCFTTWLQPMMDIYLETAFAAGLVSERGTTAIPVDDKGYKCLRHRQYGSVLQFYTEPQPSYAVAAKLQKLKAQFSTQIKNAKVTFMV